MAVTSGRGPGGCPGPSGVNSELYRRRRAPRPDPDLRWIAECPTCHRKINGRSRDIVQTVLGGHHYYIHGLRLTQAEMDAACDETIPEDEMMEMLKQSKEQTQELPLQ